MSEVIRTGGTKTILRTNKSFGSIINVGTKSTQIRSGAQGPKGDQGEQGEQGPAGADGSNGSFETYTHVQGSPANVWSINHNLNTYPSITIVDSTERVVNGDLEYVDSNNIVVTFTSTFSGKAYLN